MTLTTMFLVLTVCFALAAAQTEPVKHPFGSGSIPIGSTLSPTTPPTSWLSPSGRFAFGFYRPGSNASPIGAWLIVSPTNTVPIWTLLQKPFPRDALLKLTDTGLGLVFPQGETLPIIKFPRTSASSSMLDSGNFVAHGNDVSITFESFAHPSNTIMGGQSLRCGTQISSSVSETNNSPGTFSLIMQCDGNLVLHNGTISLWSSKTNGAGYTSLNLDTNGDFYLRSSGGAKKYLWSTPTKGSQQSTIYHGKLGWDGVFRLNSLHLDTNETRVVIEIPSEDRCQQETCGFNAFCNSSLDQPVCHCLPGFAPAAGTGCQRNFTKPACQENLDTTQYSMEPLDNIIWSDDPYSVLSSSGEDCKDECLKDCNCDAALFRDQKCAKQKLPFQGGRTGTSDSTVTFLKVLGAPPADQDTRTKNVVNSNTNTKDAKIYTYASLVALISTAFIAIGVSIFVWRYRQRLSKWELALDERIAPLCFSYHELSEATYGFKEVLGSGGFGIVYKGFLSRGKRAIAVKRLEMVVGESGFRAEMRAIGRTHHRNLVQLLGFCHEDTHRLLVYEYMSNGSLADFLFKAGRRPSWKERMRIALDVAKGIHYLHEECDNRIIHCDIKPENILMDDKYTAKISDFGIAKMLTSSRTRITPTGGTRGYAAPDWNKNAKITVKADVYSYGIVLLEIICCRRNMEVDLDGHGISKWVYNLYAARKLENLSQGEDVDMAELEKLVRVGIWCVQFEPDSRPYMKKVVMMLEGYMEVPPPPPPRFVPYVEWLSIAAATTSSAD